eukprot:Pgem_evm1s9940
MSLILNLILTQTLTLTLDSDPYKFYGEEPRKDRPYLYLEEQNLDTDLKVLSEKVNKKRVPEGKYPLTEDDVRAHCSTGGCTVEEIEKLEERK